MTLKMTIRELRETIRKALRGSNPEESYSAALLDDPAVKEKSVYVPDDVKDKIESWADDMKLSGK